MKPERVPEPNFDNEWILKSWGLEDAFDEFGARQWINEFRVESLGKLDVAATAEKVGIPVHYEMPVINGEQVIAQGIIRGIGKERGIVPLAIHLNPNWSSDEHNLTFGHELGHLFLEAEAGVINNGQRDNRTEDFCEHFGRQIIVPLDQIADVEEVAVETITELMAKFGVRHTTMIYQLMLAGKLPPRILIDSGIGEVPNEFYSGKIKRHCLCLECEMGDQHAASLNEDYMPVYDFTAFDWSPDTPNSTCEKDKITDLNFFAVLNKAYGRWTEADEAKLHEEARKHAELREFLGKNTL